MSDTTRAEKLLNEVGGSPSKSGYNNRSEYNRSEYNKSLPPPPTSGTLPFSLPSSPTKPNNSNVKPAEVPNPGPLANAKAKWIVVKDKCSGVVKKQGIAAVVVFVIVAGIMAAVNPPICQTKPKSPDEKPKRSIVKILVWAVLAAALAMVIPLGIEYAKNKKNKSVVVAGSTLTAQ